MTNLESAGFVQCFLGGKESIRDFVIYLLRFYNFFFLIAGKIWDYFALNQFLIRKYVL